MHRDIKNSFDLSIVLPTTGNVQSLKSCLISLQHGNDLFSRNKVELIVFINSVEKKGPAELIISENLPDGLSLRIVYSTVYQKTAEESAFFGIQHAEGKYVWLIGDQKRFTPDGITEIFNFIKNEQESILYLNSIWQNQDGISNGVVSTNFINSRSTMSFRQFVLKSGLNFMPTAMGCYVVPRSLYDLEKWKHYFDSNVFHFSHVAVLLETAADVDLICSSTIISYVVEKNYHAGDSSEWVLYSEIAKLPRFYPWAIGLPKILIRLIENGVLTPRDIRASIVSERKQVTRFIDEVYVHLIEQIRLSHLIKSEFVKTEEFRRILKLLWLVAPERHLINSIIGEFMDAGNKSPRLINKIYRSLKHQINAIRSDVSFNELLISREKDHSTYLHSDGFLRIQNISNDSIRSLFSYVDLPKVGPGWKIIPTILENEVAIYENPNGQLISDVSNSGETKMSNIKVKKSYFEYILDFKITYALLNIMSRQQKQTIRIFLKKCRILK
jgi:hypothetical protein